MATTILILAANPLDSTRLRLDQEVREIEDGLDRAKQRDRFRVESKWAVRPRDVQRALLEDDPTIVHFCGHGGGSEGIAFEDDQGKTKLVQTEALASLFELFAEKIQCVVLNACYSETQARAIARHIPYVIGMNNAIGDKAAIEFAVAFYDAIGAGKPFEFAYKLGKVAIQMAGIPEHLTPVLIQASSPASYDTTPPANIVNLLYSHRNQPDAYVIESLERDLQTRGYQPVAAFSQRSLDLDSATPPASNNKPVAEIVFLSAQSLHDPKLQQRLERQTGKIALIPLRISFTGNLPEPLNKLLGNHPHLSWQSPADDAVLLEQVLNRLKNPQQVETPIPPESEPQDVRSPLPSLSKASEPEHWLSLVVEQKANNIIMEDDAGNTHKASADCLLPFNGSTQQLTKLTDMLADCMPAMEDKNIRLRVMTDDPMLAMLPWHKAKPVGTANWVIETGPVLRRYTPGLGAISLTTPLLLIPAGHEHAIMGDKHYAAMQDYFASYLGIRGSIPRVTSPAQLRRELGLHQPDLLYVYARCNNDTLELDSDHEGDGTLTLTTLGEWLEAAELRPAILCSLIGQGLQTYPETLANSSNLLWVQQTRRDSRIDDLETSLANVLEGLAQTEDLAYLIQQQDNNTRRDLHHYLWLNGRSPKVSLTGDDAQRKLRAALLRVMLGRTELKDRLYSGIYRSEYLNTPTLLVYAVCGDEMACTFDFPAQLQQRLQWDDPERSLPVIPFYFHLDIHPDTDAFDMLDTSLSQGLLHGTHDIDTIFHRELTRRGLVNQDCCITLNWMFRVPVSMMEQVTTWLDVWAEILCSDFAAYIPERCILLGAVCLQTDKDIDPQPLQKAANDLFSNAPKCPLRLIRIKEALGKLEQEEISDFLQYNQHWRKALQLDEFRITPNDYANWIYTQTGQGSFDSAVRLIWQQYQRQYQDYLSQQP
ncbi:MAG: CHAT domain-containing protein [Gammaproteobacteria bacterium]|nr:CHAT domain-containing protein [Gammaproteobacteria bacterium]MBU1722921.1 CHAT domain-containing protein [Gammaproteobacteria bacterium]MBU2005702.1 CHAT domain-containing protein [Gammaproteobacteria bacterium]